MTSGHNSEKELSTTALGKKLNKTFQETSQQLVDMGLIIRHGSTLELTSIGQSKGGVYKEHDKYGRYIVWPESIIAELSRTHGVTTTNLLTSTSVGKYFEISATRTNSILSELGLIEKGVKGWMVTELGKRHGGIQSQDKTSGVPYVRWPESITNNKMLVTSVREVRGDIPNPVQPPSTTTDDLEFRDKFKADFRATDGHRVRSKAEMLIDNWLYMSELVHAYERQLPIEEVVYSDFYIPTGKVYIEYWGYNEDPRYSSRKKDKIGIYEKYNFHLIQLADKEVQNLDDTLPRLLLAFGVRTE